MNRLKRLAGAVAAALLLTVALRAPRTARAEMPITYEIAFNEKTVSTTTTGVSTLTLDIGGFGSSGFAVLGATYTLNGTDGTVYGTQVIVSSMTTNVRGFDYYFYGTSSGTLTIAQTLKTPANPVPAPSTAAVPSGTFLAQSSFPSQYYFSAPFISTTTPIIEPPNVEIFHSFRALTSNPIFYLTGLNPSATYYLTVDFGVPHKQ